MALIGKIRAKSGLAVGLVGGALILFILADAFKGMFTPDVEQEVRATVYGEPVDMLKVQETEQLFLANAEINARNEGRELSQEERNKIKEQAFQEEVRKIIMGRQLEALGIQVSSEELNFLVKGDGFLPPCQDIQNIFRDSTGQFSMQVLNNFLTTTLPNLTPEQQQEWQKIESNIRDNRMTQKYVNLVAKSMYVTSLEAKRKYVDQNQYKQIQFVVKKFSDGMSDPENEVSDEELRSFYEAHKNEKKYEQKIARKFKYVEIPFMPSQADFDRYERRMEKLKAAFEKTQNDSLFVVNNSNAGKYNPNTMYSVGPYRPNNYTSYPPEVSDALDTIAVGGVVGPYKFGPSVCLAKKVGEIDQRLAWVRHILIKSDGSTNRNEEQAKSLADSLIKVIKANNNFTQIVTQFSEDQGSVYNGGEYKWFPEGQMVPEFNDASFNGKIGDLQLVKTTFGYHIVEVLGRKDKSAQLALIFKEVKAGDAANNEAFDKALALSNKLYENKAIFDSVAKDSGLVVKEGYVNIENPMIFNFKKGETSVLKFVFNSTASKLDISSPILTNDGVYSIIQLTDIIDEGAPEFETVKEQMRFEAKKDKIAKKYATMLAGKNTLEEVAQAANSEIKTAKINFENTNIQGVGNEPLVIGAIFSQLKEGQMTVPITGNSGVYVVLVTNVLNPQETTDYTAQKEEMKLMMTQNVSSKIYQGLVEEADLQDDRKKIEFGAK
ncbi:MAG: peptidylprolyl isomerase [Crocinitomicaceae bacterium]